MPRTSVVVEDDEDAVPLNDLLRTGEASRLRRRGAMRATGHRRDDDEDTSALPFHRTLKVDEVHLQLSCGIRSAECSFAPARASRSSPLPRSPSSRQVSDLGFVFSSTGCGADVSTSAFPASSAPYHVYMSMEPVSTGIARLSSIYLDPEQRALADSFTKNVCGCQCDWQAIGCRVCGNLLGFVYTPCHPRHATATPTYVFFPSAVTSSPNYNFSFVEPDDISVDSSTLSPRVTRYFRSDDEFPPWIPDPDFTWTPPRSPPVGAAFIAWQGVGPPPVTQAHASRIATDRLSEDTQREAIHWATAPEPVGTNNAWRSNPRSISPRRTERPQLRASDTVQQHPEEIQPLAPHVAIPYEQRVRERLGMARPDSLEGSARTLEPPALHRVPRRPLAPTARRPSSFEWSSRGRYSHLAEANASWTTWTTQGSEERPSRGARPPRRVTMPLPVPPPMPVTVPAFTLLDSAGEQSFPLSPGSSFDTQNALNVNVEVETERDANFSWWRNESLTEGTEVMDLDGETLEGGEDDSEEKEDDLAERRVERSLRGGLPGPPR